jgi:hypothetical protein
MSGLEFALLALLFMACVQELDRHFIDAKPRRSDVARLGLLLALACLTRIDQIVFTASVGLFVLIGRDEGRPFARIGRFAALCAPSAIAIAGYSLANLIGFGRIGPVSAFVKSEWSTQLAAGDPVCIERGWIACKVWNGLRPLIYLDFSADHAFRLAMSLGVFGMAATLALGPLRRLAPHILGPWLPVCLFGVVSYGLYATIFHGNLSFAPWYFIVEPYFVALLLGFAFEVASQQLGPGPFANTIRPVAMLFILVQGARTLRHQWHGRNRDPQEETAAWIRLHLPPGAIVGAWNAGRVGYSSGHPVVPLDGVVNSWDYALHDRSDLCRYWRRAGVDYIADTFQGREALSVVPTLSAYRGCLDSMTEVWSDATFGQPWRIAVYRLSPTER